MRRTTFITRLMLLAPALSLALAGLVPAAAAEEKDKSAEPSGLDQMNLAKVMLQDSHFERALAVLRQVDPTAEGVVEMEYWRLLGLTYFKLQQYRPAEQGYAKAIELGDLTVTVFLQRAFALLQLEDPKAAIGVLEQAPPEANRVAARYVFESNAYYALGDKHSAFRALDQGHAVLPDDDVIAKKRVLLLVDLGLFQTAVEAAQEVFSEDDARPEDFIALATALIEANQRERASLLLEQGVLLFPEDLGLRARLAVSYYEQDKPLAAGDIIYPAALIDETKAESAAELYLKAGRHDYALRLNARIDDQAAKVRQRLILLLEGNHFEAAAALDARVERLGLLEDENVAYALAYAHYRAGSFDRMERLLSLIRDAGLFRKANQLRRSAEACRQSVWRCD